MLLADWQKFVMNHIRLWARSVYTYLGASIPTHVVYYEEIARNPYAELKKIIKFIGVDIDRVEQKILCAIGDLDAKPYQPSNEMNPFSNQYKALMNRYIGNVRKTLQDQNRGFDSSPYYEQEEEEDEE